MKLKYRLEKWEKALVFQILEQDERFRSKTESSPIINFFHVSSSLCPAICDSGSTYLRGSAYNEDLHIPVKHFESNEARDKRFDEIQASLKDWAANWPGWKENACEGAEEGGVFVL